MSSKNIVLLGSTGSVGTQTVDVALANPDRLAITGLAAGANVELLAEQAVRVGARSVALAEPTDEDAVRAAVSAAAARQGLPDPRPSVTTGPDAAARLAADPRTRADVVLNAITGSVGLKPTLDALAAGIDVALANKESLIVGGDLVLDAAAASGATLIPVDSEHSAIAQALRAGTDAEVDRLIVTASGGPFRGMSQDEMRHVTPAQALAHPTWDMGKVITTNSATLVNKGLEVIEAHLLFGVPFDRIDVVVHPQSQVHSMVQFVDGATIAQVSPPDMRLPIAYALGTPQRIAGAAPANDWRAASTWTFEPVDDAAFPALGLARTVGAAGGTFPAVFNAANEECVLAFHDGRLGFLDIIDTVARVVDKHEPDGELTYESVLAAEDWARDRARSRVAEVAS
ncbi:1-deoxy-D-xylulose-5-phosphate reductoisomerase [Spelaeicoccus albus]|uniref:1-deoxy-D-xylulose 5-phosphate reductoisomerase n=1 Tax=Spelaeicoccus albus TaxID=1280376 RepID=A0A7Z0D2Q1_9MICO|nr:1-deoxy-D-xylulose-5-phosphate reductoisomerase [Spelaeicoccus albus]NYI67765.1 1-deoxy-D-xylulose-5-phosphate reductoisomerase [Spelaeicoccus albus]